MEEIKVYQINRIVNRVGFRLKFELKVVPNNNKEFFLYFKDLIEWEELKYYELFFKAGAVYFFEKYKKRGYDITIYNIDYMPVDTTHMVIMYGIIEALSDFFNYNIPEFSIGEDGVFRIHK